MKLKAVIIILAVCLAVITAGAALNIREGGKSYASADSSYNIRVQKITSRTPGGSELVIAEKEWGRHIKIYYESNAPR